MGATYSQFFPPVPTLTQKNLPSQAGKVFIITGGAGGVGYHLARILYSANATVYIAGRNASLAAESIRRIRAATITHSTGALKFLQLDLADLSTIKPAVGEFLRQETRLDVLWCNAGVSNPPRGSVSAQGHDLTMATNCLGHSLLADLLTPVLVSTAKGMPEHSGKVRVIWTASVAVDIGAAKGGGLAKSGLDHETLTKKNAPNDNYTLSKMGNWALAQHFQRKLRSSAGEDIGILSITQNPGNLYTDVTRHFPNWFVMMVRPLLYEAVYGAYTELWAGLSDELSIQEDAGKGYVVPWGRRHPAPRQDLVDAVQGADGRGFGEWCDSIVESWK